MAEKKEQSLEDQSLEEIFSDLEQTIKEKTGRFRWRNLSGCIIRVWIC